MDVKFIFNWWSGDRKVEEDESQQIVLSQIEVRGHCIDIENVRVLNEGPFLVVELREVEDEESPFLDRSNAAVRALREELTPSEWLMGTGDDVLLLPVARMEWVERVYAVA